MPDTFRRECLNVGVVVERQGEFAAKFFGESTDGSMDGRTIRKFEYPSVYKQWVNYWRRAIRKGKDSDDVIDRLMRPNGDHFNVIDGGELDGTIGDSLNDVCRYAYGMLVSEGKLSEVTQLAEEEVSVETAADDLLGALKQLDILSQQKTMFLKQPVFQRWPLAGTERQHTFTLAQEHDGWDLIESLTFNPRTKNIAKDHGGWAAFAFNDVRSKHGNAVHPIVVLRYAQSDAQDSILTYTIGNLAQAGARFVNWNDAQERRLFLSERASIAHS